ncbi:MAG TPA: STAS domain-containing protein [Streptosporangiaceae bacterium]|nr:STAS domain-containing protein [Streptosporangiaceae bacterium]
MRTFHASVVAGESGPLIGLTGEADITNAAELSELITGQLAGGTLHLTVDVAGLNFADTAAIRVFILAAKTLRQRGGDLVLLRPQRTLARVLEILGVDEEVIAIRGKTEARPEAEP